MNKLTAEKIAAEMDAFEKLYPIPRYTSRCGNGYAVSEFNAWDGHEYCKMWKGWIARAEIALPDLEQREKGEDDNTSVRDESASFELLPGESEYDRLNRMYQWMKAKPTYRQIENDHWIEWGGGVMPVHEDTLLEVRFSDGGEDGPDPAYSWHWNHMGHSRDVFAYRVIENDGREG